MSPGRPGRSSLLWMALAVAALLHAPSHVAWQGGPAGRGELFEDRPALVANPRIQPSGSEGLAAVLGRAATDPLAAWGDGGDAIGTSRWRPMATLAASAQRWVLGTGSVVRGAALVSLALHLCVVVLSLQLLDRAGVTGAARWLAAAVVAATPAALPAAAWPAHQGTALAACAGLAGLLTALRGGAARGLAGGSLIALGALSHEMALAFLPALWLLRPPAGPDAPERRVRVAAAALPAGVVAVFAAVYVLPRIATARFAVAAVRGPVPDPLDGVAGIVHALVSTVLPARLHFADGPWVAHWLARIGAAAALFLLVRATWRDASPGARLFRAGTAMLAPLALTGLPGVVAGAPFHDGAQYLALPFLAGAIGCGVAAVAARGGAWRPAAAAAGALWVGATVAATVVRAPSFRTREAQAALAVRETRATGSAVADAWALSIDTAAWVGKVRRTRVPPEELARRAAALGRRAGSETEATLGRDPVAAYSVATAITQTAATVAALGLPRGEPVWEDLAEATESAAQITPGWVQAWLVASRTCTEAGMLRKAADAVNFARQFAPDDVLVIREGVSTALAVGRVRLAATLADGLLRREEQIAREHGRKPDPGSLFLFAQAAAADGRYRAPHPTGGPRIRMRYEWALQTLLELAEGGNPKEAVREQLYVTALRYGDVLASMDRTALAVKAYERAMASGARDTSEAREHVEWLAERLLQESVRAGERLERARRGEGNIADAMVGVAESYSRRGQWKEAAEVLDVIEYQTGRTPELRLRRAVLVWGEESPGRAIAEIRAVLAERPDIAPARFELAKLLEEQGDVQGALAEYREASRTAVEQAIDSQRADEWILDADERADALQRLLDDEAGRAAPPAR